MISAFKDSRYKPISIEEVKELKVVVSYLREFEDKEDPYDWERGKHGITLSFEADDKEYSSTYLPEVPFEHFDGKEKAMIALVKKAGLSLYFYPIVIIGYKGDYETVKENLSLERYLTSRFVLSFNDYLNEKAVSKEEYYKIVNKESE